MMLTKKKKKVMCISYSIRHDHTKKDGEKKPKKKYTHTANKLKLHLGKPFYKL